MPRLSELRPGDRGRISQIEGQDPISQRLMEMGLFEGDVVQVVAFAPLGDPMEVSVGGTCLSVRLAEAARICVEEE